MADPRYFNTDGNTGIPMPGRSSDFLCNVLKFKHGDGEPNVVRTIGFIEQAICSQFFAAMGFHCESPSALTLGGMLRVTNDYAMSVATCRAEFKAVHAAWFFNLADRLEKDGN